jgi:hypothetical protein
MLEEHPLMEYLDFTYSSLGQPTIQDDTITIPVREITVSKGFMGFQFDTIFKDALIILKGVQSSKREIAEYKSSEKDEFNPSYMVEDEISVNSTGKLYLFDLSAFSYDPSGWVEWTIIAGNIDVEGGEILKVFDN